MEFLKELFVTALLAIVLSLIVAISIAMSGTNEEKNGCGKNKVEKMVTEEVKLDKTMKVKGSKSKKKRVKFADDVVVVKSVDLFKVAEEQQQQQPIIKGFEFSQKMSEKVGFLEDTEAEIIKGDDQFGGVEVVPCSVELIKKFDGEKSCKDAGLLGSEVVEENIDATKADGVKGKSEVVGGLEGLDVGDKMMSEEIGGDPLLEAVKGEDQKGDDEAKDGETKHSELLDKALEEEAIEEKSKGLEVNLDKSCVGGGLEDMVVDKELKCEVLDGQKEVEMVHDTTAICQNEASDVVEAKEEGLGESNALEEGLVRDENIDDDDDWEGVESSELEKLFAEAVNYVECGGKGKDDQLSNVGSGVQRQLYGLQRLALDGPCHEPQPMALKVSARAKWNAWQRLGSMSPEVAMEQYIKLLSDTDPGWAQNSCANDDDTNKFVGSESKKILPQDIQSDTEDERKLELEQGTASDGDNLSSGAKSMEEVKE